jgi:hypothetical protein
MLRHFLQTGEAGHRRVVAYAVLTALDAGEQTLRFVILSREHRLQQLLLLERFRSQHRRENVKRHSVRVYTTHHNSSRVSGPFRR